MAQTFTSVNIRQPRVGDFRIRRRADEVLIELGHQVRIVCASPGNRVDDIADLEAELVAMEELETVARQAKTTLKARVAELRAVAERQAAS